MTRILRKWNGFLEHWDILDRYGNKTGRTIIRGKKGLSKGEYHLVVHIWVINSKGEFLIQRRSDTKPLMPGEWAATGGSAFAGEGSRHAALRELREELGIHVTRRRMVHVKRQLRKYSLNDIYAVRCNIPAEKCKLQKDEVAEVKWVSLEELKRMVENGEYHNYGKNYFEIIYSIDEFLKRNKRNYHND